jgi:4-oxalmesaconate hydratase
LLTKTMPVDNILLASEMAGAVKGIDPKNGFNFDEIKHCVDAAPNLSAGDKEKIFSGNAYKVYPRLKAQTDQQARGNA